MAELNEELCKWFEELQKLPIECHLLCPKINSEDTENYKIIDDSESKVTADEKKHRIERGQRRIEVTYWNSLIFGFDKSAAGKWLEEFKDRIEQTLRTCSDCVLNWHMQRPVYLQKFSEKWNEDVIVHIRDMLDRIDIGRIDHNLNWAKEYIRKIEDTGAVFQKKQFGDNLPTVLITVYEALCCAPFLSSPEHRAVFQFVFMRIQGKNYLKLGSKDPLPGMTFFLFDQKNEDRRKWAQENWKAVDVKSITEPQFDWAVSDGLVSAMDGAWRKDLQQATTEVYLELERFWQGFATILSKLPETLIHSRLQSMELPQGCPNIYELLFTHLQYSRFEGVLVVTIRVLTSLLKEAPNAFWDVVGDARPTVIADFLFSSSVYKTLLRQSLDDCWEGFVMQADAVPFPTSWIQPWIKSLTRARRYDACEVLMHTLCETLAKDPSIGEPGQAACIRAMFDTINALMADFLDPSTQITGTTHFFASAAFNLVGKNKDLILGNLRPPQGSHQGWTTFRVPDAAKSVLRNAMRLDMRTFAEEFHALPSDKPLLQSAVIRNSKDFWETIVEVFDSSAEQISLAKDVVISLERLISVEQIRPRKTVGTIDELARQFNESLTATTGVLTRILTRISEVDATDLNILFTDRSSFRVIVGLSVHGDSDLAEGSAEILKNWTGELSRSEAIQHMSHLHPDETLLSIVWTLERVLKTRSPCWGPIRPILHMSKDVLQGLCDPTRGVLRTKSLDPRSAAIVLRWWSEQWRFVSKSCLNIEPWSLCIPNSIMTEFCREIMELAEALIAEDGLLTSATALGKSEQEAMPIILGPAKDNFRGMENMIRLKDRWLVDVTVRVLCKILTRLRENKLEINAASRKFITDACVPTGAVGKFLRPTNLNDQQRAELLQALGHEEDVQIIQLGVSSDSSERNSASNKIAVKKQSNLEAWSKSAPPGSMGADPKPAFRTNRDDVLELSRSADSPVLKQLAAQRAKAKNKLPDQKAILALKESRQREKAEKAKRDAEAIARAKKIRGETVPGEGSGIHTLGVTGKDHGRSEIMVNSSDEDSDNDSDDSDSDEQLAHLSTGGPKDLDEHDKRRQQALRDRLRRPVKKVRQQRTVKEMRARLIPPMDRLHNTILAWDIFHESNDPPDGPKATEVATKYPDPRSYQATFFPLLASEAWRSFVTAKDEIVSQPFGMKIASRANVDSYLEVAFTMPVTQNREMVVSEGDILLVSEADSPLSNPSAKHCLARVHRRTYKKDVLEITYRVASRNNQLIPVLTPGVTLYGIKVTNMTTIEREYAALESLQYYDLMEEILKAEPSPILRYSEERISNTMQNWSLNHGQALAVLGAHENDGFTLIQGPPGTGKTKTITAMVGSLLSEQLAQASNGVPVGPALRPLNALTSTSTTVTRAKKLLVCAPSNAAVDELVLRLKNGVKTSGGKIKPISVLRLGRSDAINAAVKDVTLDELVRKRLEDDKTKDKAKAERDKLHEDAAKIKEQLSDIRQRLDQARAQDDRATQNTLSRKFDEFKRQQMQIGKQIDANKDSGNSLAREMELRRRQIQQEILNSAHVICATLSGSGHEMFRNLDVEFETVIIDEAAQCVELSALIPLKYGCCKCILVGDPKQLPPTVLSQSAAKFGYDQSLFVRMQQNHPKSVHLLDMQYRMHPEISVFPSKEFYEGQLHDGQDMLQLRQQPWHKNVLLGPYRFFDVEGVQAKGRKGQSLVNTKELDVALEMFDRFSREYKQCDLGGKIGIITPYKAQLFEMRKLFQRRYGENITDVIEFNTTDAFQGRECEIIIFSCVRASSTGGIGFMTDIRRMNVGLTRAKSSLWILGDSRALIQGEFWRKLIEDAKTRDCYTKGDILGMFRQPLKQAGASLYSSREAASPRDIEMPDAPPTNDATQATNDTRVKSITMNDDDRPSDSTSWEGDKKPRNSSNNYNNNYSSGTNTDGNVSRGGGPPIIKTSDGAGNEQKKRPLDSPDSGQQQSKRIVANKQRGGLMGKFGQRAPAPLKAPKDPSAMSVLGLVPPERPPAPVMERAGAIPTNPVPNGSTSSSTQSDHVSAQAKPMNKAPPQIRKKAKPSLFMPKKR